MRAGYLGATDDEPVAHFLPPQLVPRWAIFSIDLALGTVALGLAFAIRFEFAPPLHELAAARAFLPLYWAVRGITMLGFRTYAGIIRFSGSRDARRVLMALSVGTALFIALDFLLAASGRAYPVPLSVVAIELLASAVFLIGFRIAVRSIYERFQTARPTAVVIFGAGEAGIITKQAVERPSADPMRVVAFLDDDPDKHGKRIDGATIHPAANVTQVLQDTGAKRLIVSIQSLDPTRKAEVTDAALMEDSASWTFLPPRWIQGELSAGQLRDVRIEDLLGRPTIELDATSIAEQVRGARVLVTGGAGSIGSELVMQALARGAEQVLALDLAETPLHDLGLLARSRFGSRSSDLIARIGDVGTKPWPAPSPNSGPASSTTRGVQLPRHGGPALQAWTTNVMGTASSSGPPRVPASKPSSW